MATRFRLNFEQIFGTSAQVLAGGTLTFAISGGAPDQLQAIYSDDALTVAKLNPVTLDSAGKHGDIFLQAKDYRVIVKDAAGIVQPGGDVDPVHGGLSDQTVTASGGNTARSISEHFSDFLTLLDFGGVPDDATDNAAAINTALSTIAASGGGTLWITPGTYRDSGSRTLPPKVNLMGMGMGAAILKYTAAAGVQFNMPSADEASVEYGGNYIHGLTFLGAGTTGATCFKIKNKVNIRFDHCELDNYKYLIEGVRDNQANSVNNIGFTGVRFGRCKTAIYAARQWNGLNIDRTCQFTAFEDWAVIVYDSAGITIAGVFHGNPTTAHGAAGPAGHVFLGGCAGIEASSYHEGDPAADHFFNITSNKDVDGNAAPGGIPILPSGSAALKGLRGSSAGGRSYVLKLDRAIAVVSEGCHAASGIGTAFARLTAGTRGNTFIGCYPVSGLVASFEAAADEGFNPCQDLNGQLLTQIRSYTVATLPSVAAPGQIAYVTNEVGGQTLAISNGTNWLRMQDRAIVS